MLTFIENTIYKSLQNSFLSLYSGNVMFNGPRAGINANDGFGGGDVISHNLVFSSCRESGDHGPFNSWDRQPFLTTIRNGTPSMTPAWREIHHNFFVDNYSPQENVDNDDGSAYYKTRKISFVLAWLACLSTCLMCTMSQCFHRSRILIGTFFSFSYLFVVVSFFC